MTYDEWITEYEFKNKTLLGQCAKAVKEMIKEFSELKEVRGYVFTDWGMRGHWWCVSPDGEVVDPTASQFNVIFYYEEWKPGMEVRVGKCMNCGEEIFATVQSLDEPVPTKNTCSEMCEKSLLADLNSYVI